MIRQRTARASWIFQQKDDSTLLVSTFEGNFWYDLHDRTYEAVNFDRVTTLNEVPLSDDNANWTAFLLEGNILIFDSASKWFYKFSLEKNGQPFSFRGMGFAFDEWDNLWFGSWGEAPMSFIRKVRLHKARELLQHTDLTVAEIAYQVGFTDGSYVSRAFGKEFGEAPTELRK